MCLRNRSSGFTLIELLIVLALVAIVALVALPGFNQILESNRQTTVTNSMLGLLNFARSEAVRRGETVEVTPAGDGFVATSFPGGVATVVREMGRLPGEASVTRLDGGATLTFGATGRSNAAASIARYQVCGASGVDGTVVRVNRGGQISAEPTRVVCP